jgi:hypothetical protein
MTDVTVSLEGPNSLYLRHVSQSVSQSVSQVSQLNVGNIRIVVKSLYMFMAFYNCPSTLTN